jgi:hypothetical protein
MELRISVTTTTAIKFGLQHSRQGQIEEGAERRAELPPPPSTTRSPRTDTTRDSGAILKCQLFFLQVSFQMPTRL